MLQLWLNASQHEPAGTFTLNPAECQGACYLWPISCQRQDTSQGSLGLFTAYVYLPAGCCQVITLQALSVISDACAQVEAFHHPTFTRPCGAAVWEGHPGRAANVSTLVNIVT